METTIVIVLLVVGIIFFLIELFLIPGLSIAGIAGFAFVGGAIYYAYNSIGNIAGHITLVSSILLLGIAIWIFLRSKVLERMSLKTEITGKNDPMKDMIINKGDTGITSSRLAPMGKVKINNHIVEAKTNDDFIDPGVEVTVIEVMNTNVLVCRKI
jgi:membrane-bound ClpP family serine protease